MHDFLEKVRILIPGLKKVEEFSRSLSWDYCYQAFGALKDIDQLSLHLAFYLASWGMYRGSAGLLQTNYKVHCNAVEIITSEPFRKLRCTDDREIKKEDIEEIIKLKKKLTEYYAGITYDKGDHLSRNITPTDTLISKIMLGTLGCVPAFDENFIKGLKLNYIKPCIFDPETLDYLIGQAESVQFEINLLQKEVYSITKCYYPKMKVLDMYFWQVGFDRINTKN